MSPAKFAIEIQKDEAQDAISQRVARGLQTSCVWLENEPFATATLLVVSVKLIAELLDTERKKYLIKS